MRAKQIDFLCQALTEEGFSPEAVVDAVDRAVAEGAETTRKAYDLAKSDLVRPVEMLDSGASAFQPTGNEPALEQPAVTLVWMTNPEGVLSAMVGNYRLTVERLLPAAEARFVIRKNDGSEAAVSSGVGPSTAEAMAQAEEAANRLVGLAVEARLPPDRTSAVF